MEVTWIYITRTCCFFILAVDATSGKCLWWRFDDSLVLLDKNSKGLFLKNCMLALFWQTPNFWKLQGCFFTCLFYFGLNFASQQVLKCSFTKHSLCFQARLHWFWAEGYCASWIICRLQLLFHFHNMPKSSLK